MNTIYAIGDIHGQSGLLKSLLRFIRKDAETRANDPVLYFLGDLVDRGPDSRGTINLVMKAIEEFPGSRFHIGNHDKWFLEAMEGTIGSDILSWARHGGIATLESYDVPITDAAPQVVARTYPDHFKFLKSASLYTRHGGMVFAHAGIDRTLPLADHSERTFMWIREPFLSMDSPGDGRVVFHGHTIFKNIVVSPNRVAIDTGSFATGILSCAIHDPAVNGIFFASTKGFNTEADFVDPVLVGDVELARALIENPARYLEEPAIENPSFHLLRT
ncbi:metallophosphoesterase [Roseibium sp. RKSG952]|uniref:metallophosphoesterase n=1 Tax=Roseibium sp. RKSG952 TaxID=2529384 RepID=UPI0012BC6A25|nr:metallophosphoesterase [Roseibium sp. RKSG952]MTH95344.1 serine/threonine protein phosphatase [Roseibium sp. RKSG952]